MSTKNLFQLFCALSIVPFCSTEAMNQTRHTPQRVASPTQVPAAAQTIASPQPAPAKNYDAASQVERYHKAETRAAAFIPISSRFRDIYGNVGPSLQIEVAKRGPVYKELEAWANLEWIFMDGKPRQSCGTTDIDIINLSAGLKGIWNVHRDWIYVYGGIGPDIGFVCLENKMNCCLACCSNCTPIEKTRHICNVAPGLWVKTGSQIFIGTFCFDLFADYLYLPINAYRHTTDVGGFRFGGGIGGKF